MGAIYHKGERYGGSESPIETSSRQTISTDLWYYTQGNIVDVCFYGVTAATAMSSLPTPKNYLFVPLFGSAGLAGYVQYTSNGWSKVFFTGYTSGYGQCTYLI